MHYACNLVSYYQLCHLVPYLKSPIAQALRSNGKFVWFAYFLGLSALWYGLCSMAVRMQLNVVVVSVLTYPAVHILQCNSHPNPAVCFFGLKIVISCHNAIVAKRRLAAYMNSWQSAPSVSCSMQQAGCRQASGQSTSWCCPASTLSDLLLWRDPLWHCFLSVIFIPCKCVTECQFFSLHFHIFMGWWMEVKTHVSTAAH